jgi:sodium bicarbonate cotransporter 7
MACLVGTVRKEHKLVKGGGYHLDLLVVALSILLNSLLGIPWYVASTILSITHVRSLNRESGIS